MTVHLTAAPRIATLASPTSGVEATVPMQRPHEQPGQRDAGSDLGERLTALEAARLEQLAALDPATEGPVAAAYRASLLRILDEVRRARRRLEDGTLGACVDCQAEIPEELFELRPWSSCCPQCLEGQRG